MQAPNAFSDASQNPCSSRRLEPGRMTWRGMRSRSKPVNLCLNSIQSRTTASGTSASQSICILQSACNLIFAFVIVGHTNPSGSNMLLTCDAITRFVRTGDSFQCGGLKSKKSVLGSHRRPRVVTDASWSRSRIALFSWSSGGIAASTAWLFEDHCRRGRPAEASISTSCLQDAVRALSSSEPLRRLST
uniref:(northern house mosquito) hypothetical protein n=1 Tax=Culex pipiens TaxID=7175 RepID=A0A8D8CLA8_CULPI